MACWQAVSAGSLDIVDGGSQGGSHAASLPPPCFCFCRFAGADNGSLWFWDWTSGNSFQQQDTIVQPGSLESEAGVCAGSGCALLLCPAGAHADVLCGAATLKPERSALACTAGIYAMSFDVTGSRLVTCEADKTIKMWKEDETATPESHPVIFKPPSAIKRF